MSILEDAFKDELLKVAKEYDLFKLIPEGMKRTRGAAAKLLWWLHKGGPWRRAAARSLGHPSTKAVVGAGIGGAIGAPIPLPLTTAMGAVTGAAVADAPRILKLHAEEVKKLPEEVKNDLAEHGAKLIQAHPGLLTHILEHGAKARR